MGVIRYQNLESRLCAPQNLSRPKAATATGTAGCRYRYRCRHCPPMDAGGGGGGDDARSMSIEPPPGDAGHSTAVDDYEASARAVAEKVRRQQEGLETAMLAPKFADEDFRSVDDIKRLLDAQIAANASTSHQTHNSSFLTKMRAAAGGGGAAMGKADAQELGKIFLHRVRFYQVLRSKCSTVCLGSLTIVGNACVLHSSRRATFRCA